MALLSEFLSNTRRRGWTYVPLIGYYIPDEHRRVVIEVAIELANQTVGKHGTRSGHVYGCKGPLCKKAQRDYMRDDMRARRGTLGTRRSAYQDIDPLLDLLQEYYLATQTPEPLTV